MQERQGGLKIYAGHRNLSIAEKFYFHFIIVTGVSLRAWAPDKLTSCERVFAHLV